MVHMEDENLIHRAFNDRINFIGFRRNGKTHIQEITCVGQIIAWDRREAVQCDICNTGLPMSGFLR